jgi:hypothetical protein
MTRQEAEQYLVQQNYCLTHCIEKSVVTRNPFSNAYNPYLYCPKCVEEDQRIRREKIEEAVKVLNG